MPTLKLNDAELKALRGLTDFQFRIYVASLRRRMDYATGLVGVDAKLSYQAIHEDTEETPSPGHKGRPKPSKDQMYRALCTLERKGLIENIGQDRQLILKCLLADTDQSVSDKAATRPRQGRERNRDKNGHDFLAESSQSESRPRIGETLEVPQAATPSGSGNRNKSRESLHAHACAHEDAPPAAFDADAAFDRFWSAYPKKRSKGDARKAWGKLTITPDLLARILATLEKAKVSHDWQKDGGKYVPHPASWLNAEGWEDEFDEGGPGRTANSPQGRVSTNRESPIAHGGNHATTRPNTHHARLADKLVSDYKASAAAEEMGGCAFPEDDGDLHPSVVKLLPQRRGAGSGKS